MLVECCKLQRAAKRPNKPARSKTSDQSETDFSGINRALYAMVLLAPGLGAETARRGIVKEQP